MPADWSASPNLYVDLNAPQQTFLGPAIYPILDPGALTSVQGVKSDTGDVAMPVQWLYQLQDGTLGPASGGTKDNPIVARIAYWTDDETCKIDVNTAGCGSAWNIPRLNSADDQAWSTTQPALGEFSRYPGHPAMTSLLPVFPVNTFTPQQLLGLTPRYGWGGSQFGAQPTAAGDIVPAKTDRLYASVDELRFGSALISGGQRAANPVTPEQIEQARFVLTAHSVAPETTLRGEPRVAVWPVADDPSRTTAVDRAIAAAATVGSRDYFFQRHDAMSATDDFDGTTTAGNSNLQLFQELIARGGEAIPGYAAPFTAKYPGAKWPQLILEAADFIRSLNTVDLSPPPFVPFADTDPKSGGAGRGFVVPLQMNYEGAELRGFGRCPTLSSLTLVIYVCGFGFDDAPDLDFDALSDDARAAAWSANFPARWSHVTSELLRAFVVPCTFQSGCAFPEVSDNCLIKISGLDKMNVSYTSGTKVVPGSFQFRDPLVSPRPLGAPFQKLKPDRAWGGNEGPRDWRLAGDQMAQDGTNIYPFAGAGYFKVQTGSWAATSGGAAKPPSLPTLIVPSVPLTVAICRGTDNAVLQTLHPTLTGFSLTVPTIQYECDHYDGWTPDTADPNWAVNPDKQVPLYWYMCLANRLRATQGNKAFMIQPGDVTRSIEAIGVGDLRLLAARANDDAALNSFSALPNSANSQVHNFRFADGTSAYGAAGANSLVTGAPYPAALAPKVTGTDWTNGRSAPLPGSWVTSSACSTPTSKTSAVFMATGIYGDWDTGPGFCPDGAMINLPDAGTSLDPNSAYFSLAGGQPGAPTRFAPNALVPSPVIFGSLPAGIDPAASASSQPWRTLLFCPYPAAGALHPGWRPRRPIISSWIISGCRWRSPTP